MMDEGRSSSGFAGNFLNEDYESEFEFDVDVGKKRKTNICSIETVKKSKVCKPNKQDFHNECSNQQGKIQGQIYLSLDAYTRHKKLINDYVLCYSGATQKLKRNDSNYKTDKDIIRENHKFLWEAEDIPSSWGQQLAKKYYDRLFKEYCLCDLSRYKTKQIGMRWRTEKEVVLGKGQFFCGNVYCETNKDLNTWEVLFGYLEHGEKKNALVKLRLCDSCFSKLNYGYKGKLTLKNKNSKKLNITEVNHLKCKSEKVQSEESSSSTDLNEKNIWTQPVREELEPSQDDIFEEFLGDLFL